MLKIKMNKTARRGKKRIPQDHVHLKEGFLGWWSGPSGRAPD
jgi:hypothetical protein